MKTVDNILDILISTIGTEGIRRIASKCHPKIEGVRYIVSWQQPDCDTHVPAELQREDFIVSVIKSTGLSANRNHAIEIASAPYLLLSDDDVEYSEAYIENILRALRENKEYDIIAFRYDSLNSNRVYPEFSFNLKNPPKGYFISSIEIALKRESIIDSGVRFDTSFGLGAEFPAGEETLFINRLLKKGLKGIYLPVSCCRHDNISTGEKPLTPEYIRAKGALFRRIYPCSWFPRMLAHSIRHKSESSGISTLSYIRYWLNGVLS